VTLSDISIRNPVFAWMLMAAMILFGAIGFSRMGVSLNPDVDFPIVSIQLGWEGAAPDIMESQVVDTIEDAVTTVQGVREITSSARQGVATVIVEFELDRNIDVALQDVQTKIAQAQQRLPREMDPPVVTKANPEDQPIIWLALSGSTPLKDIMVYARDVLKSRFQSVSGVGEVFLGGWMDRNLRVWLDADKMAALQITAEDVIAAIRRQHAEIPAGQLETSKLEFNVRTMGEFPSAAEFEKLLITHRGAQPIHVPIPIRQVARIEDGLADFRRISRVNGERAVGLGMRKQRGVNSVEVARGVMARLEEVRKTLPKGMSLGVNFDSTRFIKDSVKEIEFNLLLAAVLTSLVCWAFLGSWSSTLNVLLAIPTSILATFIVDYFLGFTLNFFTLLALTLSIGIVVDDAIMVLENIVRHQEKGQSRLAAAVFGAREITFAAMSASIAVLAVFTPVIFMKGIMGKFFFQFGVTLSAAVLFSLLEALTLAPMRMSQFGSTTTHGNPFTRAVDQGFKRLARAYRGFLERALDHRWKVVGLATIFFAASMGLAKTLRKEMTPSQDQSMFMARLQTPVGSSMDFTSEKFKIAEAWMQSQPWANRYYSAVGGFGGGEVNTGIIFVTMKPQNERPVVNGKRVTMQDAIQSARKELNKIPDLKTAVLDLSQGGFSAGRGLQIEFTIRGPDWDRLTQLAEVLEKKLEADPNLVDMDSDWKGGMPEVRVVPDRAKAYARGVSIDSIGTVINTMVGGVRAGLFTDNGHRYDIRVRAEEKYRLRKEDLEKFFVRNDRGEMIRMSEVVKVEEHKTLLTIMRKDRERAIGFYCNVAPGKSQSVALKEIEQITKDTLPDGYRMVLSGASRTFRESFESLLFALVLGIIVAYMVLGAQFNSFLHPFTVLLALPFSVSGALIALWLGGFSLNIYSFIGLILLMGIVKKNSILLVDFTNQRRAEGEGVREALLDACPIRLRPILMTSIATIAAAIPAALAIGPGAEARIPMAVSVIGGVLVSTLLTLVVVPCAYSLLVAIERRPPALPSEDIFGKEDIKALHAEGAPPRR